MKIGLKIRNAREDKDLTQKDMAALIPMNQSNYSKIERDVQEPNLYQLKRIVEILGLAHQGCASVRGMSRGRVGGIGNSRIPSVHEAESLPRS